MPDPVTAIVGGSSVLGAVMGSNASENAADAQVSAANSANETQRYMFERGVQLNEPWYETGREAVRRLSSSMVPGGSLNHSFRMEDFEADPGYAFRLTEGQKALERSAAARGGLLSGRTGKDLLRYGQEMGSQEYGAAYNRWNADKDRLFNRLAALSGVGQTASRDVSSNAMTLGSNIASNTIGAGNARASGYIGSANAVSGAAGSGLSAYQSQQLIGRLGTRPYTISDYSVPSYQSNNSNPYSYYYGGGEA